MIFLFIWTNRFFQLLLLDSSDGADADGWELRLPRGQECQSRWQHTTTSDAATLKCLGRIGCLHGRPIFNRWMIFPFSNLAAVFIFAKGKWKWNTTSATFLFIDLMSIKLNFNFVLGFILVDSFSFLEPLFAILMYHCGSSIFTNLKKLATCFFIGSLVYMLCDACDSIFIMQIYQ